MLDKKFLPKVTVKYKPTVFGTLMPVALVKFRNIPQPVPRLVDSGATLSLVNPHVAKAAELKYDPTKNHITGAGAGGKFTYIPAKPVNIEIEGVKQRITFSVVRDDSFAWACILGHDFLFNNAKITFKTYKQEYDIFVKR